MTFDRSTLRLPEVAYEGGWAVAIVTLEDGLVWRNFPASMQPRYVHAEIRREFGDRTSFHVMHTPERWRSKP